MLLVVVVLLIFRLDSTVPHKLHTICLPCILAVQPAGLFTCPLICSQVLSCTPVEREHLPVNCCPFQYSSCVLSPMLLICVQSVINELEYNIVFVLTSRTFHLLKVLSVRRKSSYALEKEIFFVN